MVEGLKDTSLQRERGGGKKQRGRVGEMEREWDRNTIHSKQWGYKAGSLFLMIIDP